MGAMGKVVTKSMLAMLTGVALAGCAGLSGSPHYRCEHGIEFMAQFVGDSVLLKGPRDYDLLSRDARGSSEKQPVYSNARMRAEFGLGASGREALLHYPLLPLVARCVRD